MIFPLAKIFFDQRGCLLHTDVTSNSHNRIVGSIVRLVKFLQDSRRRFLQRICSRGKNGCRVISIDRPAESLARQEPRVGAHLDQAGLFPADIFFYFISGKAGIQHNIAGQLHQLVHGFAEAAGID